MDGSVEDANDLLRAAVAARIAAVRAGKPAEQWYDAVGGVTKPMPEVPPAEETTHPGEGAEKVFCDRQKVFCDGCQKSGFPVSASAEVPAPARLLPGTVAFLGVLDELKALHLSKTQDYGDEQGGDALANIRNGSEMVGIDHWKGGLVRAADKMQRLKTYCRTGRLAHEGVEDTLLDLAAYAVLSLVLFREAVGRDSP